MYKNIHHIDHFCGAHKFSERILGVHDEAWNQAIYRGSWFEMTGPYLGPLVPQMVTMAAGDEANLRAQGLGLFLLF